MIILMLETDNTNCILILFTVQSNFLFAFNDKHEMNSHTITTIQLVNKDFIKH